MQQFYLMACVLTNHYIIAYGKIGYHTPVLQKRNIQDKQNTTLI
jgi:hypothetical protein